MTAQPTAMGRLPSLQTLGVTTNPNVASLGLMTRPSTANPAGSRPGTGQSRLPRYVETDKQTARFYGYFYEERPWDHEGPLGESRVEPAVCRQVVVHYYIYDDTVEINEPKQPNSGLVQGNFFRRGKVNKDSDGQPVQLTDLIPGNQLPILGQTFVIFDADQFTRDYFKKELNIILPPRLKRPDGMVAEMAAQYATGLGAPLQASSKAFNTRSTDYFTIKEGLDKTNLFLKYDGQVLRFLSVETSRPWPPFFPELEEKLLASGQNVHNLSNGHGFIASANVKRYAFSYYLASAEMEVLVQRQRGERDPGMDEPKTLLKKTKMPKNWREVQGQGQLPVFYDVADFQCGAVLDIYGRYFLMVDCDSFTRRYFQQMGLPQRPVPLILEEEEQIIQPVPEAGDGFLPIGSEEDTLATVYGMPKPRKNVLKIYRNQGRHIRAKAALLTNSPIDSSRLFLLTFYLEDDTLQVYEDTGRNSGIMGGTFLKRGRYLNDLPPDAAEPRYVLPTDIYLGNVLCVQGYQFRITEMDNMSLKFCENYPDEFPMSDTFRILGLMMLKIVEMQINLRPVLAAADEKKKGYLNRDSFIKALDSLGLFEDLNDQEILTVLRRFEDNNGLIYYEEMSDFISHVFFQHQSTTGSQILGPAGDGPEANRQTNKKRPNNLAGLTTFDSFAKAARSRTIQWRRTLRKEPHTIPGKCTLAVLSEIFAKNGMVLSDAVIDHIEQRYKVPDEEAQPILLVGKSHGAVYVCFLRILIVCACYQDLRRRHASEAAYHGLDDKIQPKLDQRQSRFRKKLMSSAAIAAKLSEIRKKASATAP